MSALNRLPFFETKPASTVRGMTVAEAVYWRIWPSSEWEGWSAVELMGAGELEVVSVEIAVLPDLDAQL